MNRATLLISSLLATAASSNPVFSMPMFGGRSEPSEAQKRRIAKWQADAPRRAAEARDIAEWNKNVKRRNQRFVARQIARGRTA